VSVQLKSRD